MQDDPEADEQRIEITPLPGDSPADRFSRISPPHLSSRHVNLLVRLGTVVSIALLLLLVFPLTPPLVQVKLQTTLNRLFPSTPISTSARPLPPGDQLLYIGSDVPWVVVSIDGHPTALPRVGTDAPLVLSRGRHLIAWHADPFPPDFCVISIPGAKGDTCSVGAPVLTPMEGPSALLVTLQESLLALSSSQQAALIDAVRTAIQAPQFSDTVRLGELPAATRPLRARLRLQLDLDITGRTGVMCQIDAAAMYNQPCMLGEQICLRLCTVPPWQFQPYSSFAFDMPGWLTLAVVRLSWQYSTLKGQVIAHDQLTGNSATGTSEHLVLLHIVWDGAHWHAGMILGPGLFQPVVLNGVQVADDPACVDALAIFTTRASNYSQYRIISTRNPAQGCLLVATAINAAPDTGHDSWYLERFGSLFAANDLAHRENPSLPLPNGYEQELTAQLSTLPGQLISFVEKPA